MQELLVPVRRHYSVLTRRTPSLLNPPADGIPSYSVRGVAMLVARVLRGALKIRYLVLGGSIAGGSVLAKVCLYL